ncbi:hypothetical protein [Niveibacterium sp. SC-1]|uniref:hypothetical protein n=1 Tax=Niveibacterium sp. SC-1 TaxID=3135646 RepID=UPI00311FB98C
MHALSGLAFATSLALSGAGLALADETTSRPEAYDGTRQILYWAEAATGTVHVVGLRSGVTEYAVLREPGRNTVRELSLDAESRVLSVWSERGLSRYETRGFKPLPPPATVFARSERK